jgi:hypothetical protein
MRREQQLRGDRQFNLLHSHRKRPALDSQYVGGVDLKVPEELGFVYGGAGDDYVEVVARLEQLFGDP